MYDQKKTGPDVRVPGGKQKAHCQDLGINDVDVDVEDDDGIVRSKTPISARVDNAHPVNMTKEPMKRIRLCITGIGPRATGVFLFDRRKERHRVQRR